MFVGLEDENAVDFHDRKRLQRAIGLIQLPHTPRRRNETYPSPAMMLRCETRKKDDEVLQAHLCFLLAPPTRTREHMIISLHETAPRVCSSRSRWSAREHFHAREILVLDSVQQARVTVHHTPQGYRPSTRRAMLDCVRDPPMLSAFTSTVFCTRTGRDIRDDCSRATSFPGQSPIMLK